LIYLTDSEFSEISSYVKRNYGVNLDKKKSLIEGRLSNHIVALGYDNYKDYFRFALAEQSGDEMSVLINKLTTNHTYFLREKEHFNFFKGTVMPWVDRTLGTKDLRVWSAGCSSGQEPYTLSMLALDYLGSNAAGWDSSILATDISHRVLASAKDGVYSEEQINSLPEGYRRRFFRHIGEGRYSVNDELKKNVVYHYQNLLSPFRFKKPFQAIFCRNVMIYFEAPLKEELVRKFYDSLMPGGYLFVGLSESLSGLEHSFRSESPSIYRKVV